MIELEMENLKSHHLCVVKSQIQKETCDKATMTGLSLNISKSQEI